MKNVMQLLARATRPTSSAFMAPRMALSPSGPNRFISTAARPVSWAHRPQSIAPQLATWMQRRTYAAPGYDGHITFVKKVLADGGPCKKCVEVAEKLEADDRMQYIDKIVIAYAADPESEGMKLAAKHKLSRAPFFLVDKKDGATDVYPIYTKFVKEVFGTRDLAEEKKEKLREGSESAADFM